MSLIKSISGIRGTIGGPTGDTLNPLDIVKFTTAYATFIAKGLCNKQEESSACGCNTATLTRPTIVVGRDARLSGDMVRNVVCGTLMGCGFDVLDIGLATTPTTELAVTMSNAQGGIIITASHNPRHWNALKLLNCHGEFLNDAEGKEVLAIAGKEDFLYADVDQLGHYRQDHSFNRRHIENVLNLQLVDVEAIRKAGFRVCVDSINSVGGVILPELLDELGVKYEFLNGEPTGDFAHNPEPLEKNLTGIMEKMRSGDFHLGIVVDPDVDRLAFICEDGRMFGEEYTLVSVADYVLSHTVGNTVSNLSSTRALRDVTEKHGGQYTAAAVGEVNVTTKMKETGAIIGGEGNGGVIYPESHYGRDALVGIALFLSNLAHKDCTASELRATYPNYFMAKNRIDLTLNTDVDAILEKVKTMYQKPEQPNAGAGTIRVNDIDGVKIDFPDRWVHLRKSNTEPIIRVYSEAPSPEAAEACGREIIDIVMKFI